MDNNDIITNDDVPEGILTGISFDVLTEYEAEKMSVLNVDSAAGAIDPKLGFPNPTSECATCGATSTKHCEGHFGVINFPYTVLHPYFMSEAVQILNKICPGCKIIKRERRYKGGNFDLSSGCKYCTGRYPSIKFRLSTHDLFKKTAIIVEISEKSHNKFEINDIWDFIPNDIQVEDLVDKNKRVISHAQVHHLFKDVDPEFIKEFIPRLDTVFMNCLPVTPLCHRVTEFVHPSSSGQKLMFDDRTRAFRKLVDFRGTANELASRVLDCLKLSKLRLEKSNDSSTTTNKDTPLNSSASKWMKEVILTKRSDHIVRSVVIGDPNLNLCEIGLPCYIAERLQVAEYMNTWNFDKLIGRCNLRLLEKGEVVVRRKGELVRVRDVEDIELGDLIYRPLIDGDVMLINRPPSVHQHSMLALNIKILPMNSVVSINPLCCSPLKGDFDGDCLHGYVPQSMEARVELKELVGLEKQLRNGQSGKTLISLSHDSLTASYLLVSDADVIRKHEMQQFAMFCPQQLLLPPAVIKTRAVTSGLWTGKQLFSMLLPNDFDYSTPKGVYISKGELLSYPSGCASLFGDSDGNFLESLTNHCGGEVLDYLDASQRVLCEWLSFRGLSVSLLDLYLCSNELVRSNLIDEVSCGLEEAEWSCYLTQLMSESSIHSLIYSDEEGRNSMRKSATLTQASSNAFKYIYRDVLSLTYHYAHNGNSLLTMVKSGSKGSLSKIVQQSMCLGLQHSLVPLSFKLPPNLSCEGWNELKAQTSNPNGSDHTNSSVPFAVIKSSFVTGLNPAECFVHSVTTRDSSFSENADVPGTLTRKLTFFMRDLVLAYDSTVRNACGDQVVQFSYDGAHGTHGGHPVGALAACAMSEAAYSALDQPVSILEESPLFTIKKVMESGSRKSKGRRSVSLFLSNKLKRLHYGYEHGALEVKYYLEKLLFSDLVSTVMIVYSRDNCNKRYSCPWVCHFHIRKELLKKKRVRIRSVIAILNKECMATTYLNNLDITCKNNCTADDSEHNAFVCITTTIKNCHKKSCTDLDTARDVVIPRLLKTVVKGYPEVEKVDILWHEYPMDSRSQRFSTNGELYLNVSLSPNCNGKKAWNMLIDYCLPIRGLIDWTRSHPDDLNDTFSAFGIDVAWRSFLENLRSATTEIGKSILPEHLILLADCLSVTGEFVGLSAKGIARQKSHMSVSSPFMLACFTNPGQSFIKAAKRGAGDELQGSLEALAWGKMPRLGTGAPFEFMYSGKGHEVQKPTEIYSLLGSQKSDCELHSEVKLPNIEKLTRENIDAQHLFGLSASKSLKNITIPKKLLQKQISVDDIMRLSNIWRSILFKYPIDQRLNDLDKTMLLMALKFHPHKKEKIGSGAVDIKVGHHSKHEDSRCFILERIDGTVEDFSYKKCVLGALELIAPGRAKRFKDRWYKDGPNYDIDK